MKTLSHSIKLISIVSIVGFLSACAPHADKIQPAYVSPLQYSNYSCKQIRMEMSRISRRVNEVAGIQDKQASKDSAALGVGLVIIWPALFFMIGSDQKEELARLKGEYEAIEQAAIQKECDVAKEIQAAKKLDEERRSKQQQQEEDTGHLNE